ncbi:MAG: tetraacyldisaccharide 4'-kinase [Desulfosalsimonadaceae bacterium]
MGDVKRKIEAVMTAEGKSGQSALERILRAGSVLYGAGVRLKNTGYDKGLLAGKELPCRIISIGNIVAGGTGKTPMTIYLATMLRQMGHRVVILSRGYGGRAEKTGIVVSDGYEILCEPEVAGDEPFMMASKSRGVPVLVGGDRYKSGMRAISEFDPDTILLDDGFQHRRLRRHLDLVLVDAENMLGNGYLMPRGVLREPASALKRSGAIIFTRCKDGCEAPAQAMMARMASITAQNRIGLREKPVFRTDHAPFLSGIHDGAAPFPVAVLPENTGADFALLARSNVFVFSGIARNGDFLTVVEQHAGRIVGHRDFLDHHRYTDAECREIMAHAVSAGADFLATTEKDYVRIAGRMPGDRPIAVIGVNIVFKGADESRFVRFIRQTLTDA